jgi:hypothetical protein
LLDDARKIVMRGEDKEDKGGGMKFVERGRYADPDVAAPKLEPVQDSRRRARPRRSIELSDEPHPGHAATGAPGEPSRVCNQMAAETRAAALETPALEPSAKGNPTGNGQNTKRSDSHIDGEPIRYHRCLPSVYLNA